MRLLWARSSGGPIDENDIAQALHDCAGRSMQPELSAWVHGTQELPLPVLFERFGVQLASEAADLAAELGLRLSEGPVSGVQVRSVHRGGAAERGGVSAGDEVLAVDGWRVRRLDDAHAWIDPARPFDMLLVRDQRVLSRRITADPTPSRTPGLSLASKPSPAARALRREWLGV
jgi:predicted metalloprotease with PDZ domain